MGFPICECNEGLKYDKEQKICAGEQINCTFECPDKRCVWQYNFMGLPICNCKEDAVYNKETKTCEIGNGVLLRTATMMLVTMLGW